MNALIVFAHPEPRQSFNAAMRDVAVTQLTGAGLRVEVSDLYAMRFDAVAGPGDFTTLTGDDRFSLAHEQRHAQPTRRYQLDILREQDRVSRADLVILQFPYWWYGMPAILKGWADRVLSSDFAYSDSQMFSSGLFAGKSAMVAMTTGGTKHELEADAHITGSVEHNLRPITGGIMAFTGMSVLDPFVAYAPAAATLRQRHDMLRNYARHILAVIDALRR